MNLKLLKVARFFHLIKKEKYNEKRQIEIVKKSPFFDAKWYLEQYPDVRASGMKAVEHYVKFGWKEGRNPSINFDTNDYLREYPELLEKNWCPLFHLYLQDNQIVQNIKSVDFPIQAKNIIKKYPSHNNSNNKKVAIFASFSRDATIKGYIIDYLKELKKIVDDIIFVSDNPILESEISKIEPFVIYIHCVRHNEYDFGSYKKGYLWLEQNKLLKKYNELVLCNDSCFLTGYSMQEMFNKMEKRPLDFWGITLNIDYNKHIQSYFLVLKKNVFLSNTFCSFIKSVKKEINAREVIIKYETKLTSLLSCQGFKYDSFIEYPQDLQSYPVCESKNLTRFGEYILKNKSPLIKVKYFYEKNFNCDSKLEVLTTIKRFNYNLYKSIKDYDNLSIMFDNNIKFSIIMPTFNRRFCIEKAINSILNQTNNNYELIIVDDGSKDNTQRFIRNKYAKELKKAKIRYYYKKNEGVCRARNFGIEKAKNEWILYVDSDNEVVKTYLETFYNCIEENKKRKIKTYYACFKNISTQSIKGNKKFNWNDLLKSNFIDLGCFMHHKSLYNELGGFDVNLKRLVDWDLILTYTKKYPPARTDKVVLLYNDISGAYDRISTTENYAKAKEYLYNKHGYWKNKEFIERCYFNVLQWGKDSLFKEITSDPYIKKGEDPLVLAYYLTQFYETEINNKNFGKGFTEWTNVSKSLPQFENHYQPHIPMDVGFYNLQDIHAMKRQVELAKLYGVGGFCFYYYWFQRVRLLEKPLFNWLNEKSLDLKYCLFWANTPWVSHWMGGNNKIIMDYDFTLNDIDSFYVDIKQFFADERYIKINNKPLLLIYHPELISSELLHTFKKKMNTYAKRDGFDGVTFYWVGFKEKQEDVLKYFMDGVAEFPPCRVSMDETNILGYKNPDFTGKIYDTEKFIKEKKYLYSVNYSLLKGCFPRWDNTPRNCSGSKVYYGTSPELYKKWLKDIIQWTKENNNKEEQIVFVNAWNEWAEGAHLEPDLKYGYAYLEATKEALEETRKK